MTDDNVIPRAQAITNARAALDAARARRDADRAAGRLPAHVELILRRLERAQALAKVHTALNRAAIKAASIHEAARAWRHGLDAMDRMSVPAAARACYQPGGPSLAELEARITADRAARTRTAR